MNKRFQAMHRQGRHLAVLMLALSALPPWTIAQTTAHVFGRAPTVSSVAFGRGINPNAKVTVQVVQRDLDSSLGGTARALNDRWVHTQIIVRDEYGRILDTENIGYFADDENGINRGGSVRKETKAFDYDFTPRYEATCSYADYYAAKQEAIKRFQDAGRYSWKQFSPRATGNVRDNPSDRMSMAEFEANCQAFAEYFTERLNEKESCVTSRFYSPPGSENGVVNLDASASLNRDALTGQPVITADGNFVNQTPVSAMTAKDNGGGLAQSRDKDTIGSASPSAIPADTAAKAQFSEMLEGAYQYASGIAAEADVSAEYQSAVAPVMNQGRAAISSIPNQQTITIPSDSSPSGGYSSEIMDQIGRTFVEQGPCSAGLQLEILKNQNQNK